MGRINFDLENGKHQRFKTKASSEGLTITDVLTKFIDGYIGKWETKNTLEEKAGGIIAEITEEMGIKETPVIPPKEKLSKLEIINNLRGQINGVIPQNYSEDIQKIPAEDFPKEEIEEVEYTPDKQ